MASKKVSPTLKVLTEIREELRDTRAELRGSTVRLDGRIDSLATEMRESNIRVTTELVAVSSILRDVRDLLRTRLDDRDRLEDHERRLLELEQKVG